MKTSDIPKIRLLNQGLSNDKFKSATDCLDHMGVMQAQDFNMVKWALGIRIKDTTLSDINKAIDSGKIIRTHLLRPTWHLVSAKNIYWMLELSAVRIRAAMKSRDKQLGLTEKIFTKSNRVIEKAFEKEDHLTRDELLSALRKAKIAIDENRSSHIFLYAELSGLICSGQSKGIKNTYALLEKRTAKPTPIDKEEALAKLAKIYFKSHGPATLHDFTWWSGLSPANANLGLEQVKKDFDSIKIGEQIFFAEHIQSIPKTKKEQVHLLPAYDEFIISYKDRSATVTIDHHKKAISNNGIFNPTIVVDGRVIGIWKRSIEKDSVIIESNFFDSGNEKVKNQLKKAAKEYGRFLDRDVEILF